MHHVKTIIIFKYSQLITKANCYSQRKSPWFQQTYQVKRAHKNNIFFHNNLFHIILTFNPLQISVAYPYLLKTSENL